MPSQGNHSDIEEILNILQKLTYANLNQALALATELKDEDSQDTGSVSPATSGKQYP